MPPRRMPRGNGGAVPRPGCRSMLMMGPRPVWMVLNDDDEDFIGFPVKCATRRSPWRTPGPGAGLTGPRAVSVSVCRATYLVRMHVSPGLSLGRIASDSALEGGGEMRGSRPGKRRCPGACYSQSGSDAGPVATARARHGKRGSESERAKDDVRVRTHVEVARLNAFNRPPTPGEGLDRQSVASAHRSDAMRVSRLGFHPTRDALFLLAEEPAHRLPKAISSHGADGVLG